MYVYMYIAHLSGHLTIIAFCKENFESHVDPDIRFCSLNQNFILGASRPHKIHILGMMIFFPFFIGIDPSANFMGG